MNEKYTSPQETLNEIKHLMERSSRFISLSGFSGIFAGIYALLGAIAAYYYLQADPIARGGGLYETEGAVAHDLLIFFLTDAALVLILAVGTGIFLTTRKAKRDGNSIFDAAARKLLINLGIPLVAGGIFCLAMVYHGNTLYVAPAMLIFYGLALLHASKYTRDVVRSLGLTEIALGLIALFIVGYGLLFWALGFGVLHIVYGIYMYFKYEK